MKNKTRKTVLVLSAFSNGHEAAMQFIEKQKWDSNTCDIVFCGNHQELLKRLTQSESYAVVPIYNSIVGGVSEVVNTISKFRIDGYELEECDRIDLQVNHCLVAQFEVHDARELTKVISHEKAIQQCGIFLASIGLQEKTEKRDSTGDAAKAVSKMDSRTKIGAISTKAAAEEYGLNILAENIQDVADNKTTFLLLKNDVFIKNYTVGIIGINGLFGQVLKTFFESLGCTVIGSDVGSSATNEQVVKNSDVVIFSVPIRSAPGIIRPLMIYTRADQLLMDVTSVKQPAVESMMTGNAQVVGLHPMFRPGIPFTGQTFVVCPERQTMSYWKTWVLNVLAKTGAKINWSNPEEHDSFMQPVQVNPHVSNLVTALLMTRMNIPVEKSLEFTSPFYLIMLSLVGRLVGQSPDLYSAIIIENPQTLAMLDTRIGIYVELRDVIQRKDYEAMQRMFAEAKSHFGEKVVAESNDLFARLLSIQSTLSGNNSIVLQFDEKENKPGLLERIAKVFGERKINLTGINSVVLGSNLQFNISFDETRDSDNVRRALEVIENWSDITVKVLRL